MARQRKGPWRRGQNGHWYTTVGKKLVKVADKSASYAEAFQKYIGAIGQPQHEPPTRMTVGVLFNAFLAWVKTNRADTTYTWYRGFCKSFVESVGVSLKVTEVKPYHVQQWLTATLPDATSNTKHGAIRALLRGFNWGSANGMIDRNPITSIEKPSRKPREVYLTEKQFQELLGHVPDQQFKDYLSFVWGTGCRSQEIRLIEPHHRDGNKLILERTNSKGERYNRVIYLSSKAAEILARSGGSFRNTQGRPWTANSVRCRFRTLKTKMGIPELCTTTLRHSWATNTLKGGMDTTTASVLMGHRDPSTLIKNYQHLAKDHEYLAKAAESARQGVVVQLPLPAGTGSVAPV